MVDRAYDESQLYLPHPLRGSERFERHPKLRVRQRRDEDRRVELEDPRRRLETEQSVERTTPNWLNTLQQKDAKLRHPDEPVRARIEVPHGCRQA